MIDYRATAREALDRARRELATGDMIRVSYAALEIRNALEAVAYERALSYEDRLPAQYKKWTPRALLEYLEELDPEAERQTSQRGQGLTDGIVTWAKLKAKYEILDSYLHFAPTTQNADAGTWGDARNLRSCCELCVDSLEKVLSSDFWGLQFGVFADGKCARCGETIMKRLDPKCTAPVPTRCIKCGASYTVALGAGEVSWQPNVVEIPCGTPNCETIFAVWPDEVEPGISWTCPKCGSRWKFGLAIFKVEREAQESEQSASHV